MYKTFNVLGGTYIDGNAVRAAFRRPVAFSHLIDFPVDLIRDFHRLIVAITSGADVSPTKYKELADSWLDRFHRNEFISWNVLSPTGCLSINSHTKKMSSQKGKKILNYL